ncbi:MAG: 7TM diverse intracellular signaling domain-containing protein [Bacteroidota bacterium]|jgi:signal transduction histidine kinase
MKQIKDWCLVILCSLLTFLGVYAQRKVTIQNPNEAQMIGREIEIFEDKTALLTFEEVSKRSDIDARFTQSIQPNPNFGVTSSVVWARFTLQNKSSQKLYLEMSEPVMDSIDIYRIDANNRITHKKSGVYVPVSKRDFHTNFYLFDLNLNSEQTCTYYIRFQNSLPLLFPLRVAPLKVYFEDNHSKDLMQGVYLGLMLVMAIFNFFIYWTVRSKEYLYYVLYVFSFACFFAYNKGIAHEFVWNNALWFNRFTPLFISSGVSFGVLFANSFLDVKRYFPLSQKISQVLIGLIVLCLIGHWLGLGSITITLLHLVAFLIVIYVLMIATYVWLEGSQSALFFLIAWSVFLVSALIFIMQLSNILPSDNFTRNALQVGSALEVVLLSFALAYRINGDRKEKEKYQAEVIRQLQANEQMRSRIARDLHDDIGSTLSSIGILSQVVENQMGENSDSVKEMVRRIGESSQKVQRSLSDIVWTTKQTEDNFDNVLVKMKEFTSEMLEVKDIIYHFNTDTLPDVKISPSKQYNFYLIFKEAVNNIVKYSNADEVIIELNRQKDLLIMNISDNGIGFDEKNIKSGNGLGNMRKRAESLGGKITIDAKCKEGTKIRLEIPV